MISTAAFVKCDANFGALPEGTPEQYWSSMQKLLTDNELRDWATAFASVPNLLKKLNQQPEAKETLLRKWCITMIEKQNALLRQKSVPQTERERLEYMLSTAMPPGCQKASAKLPATKEIEGKNKQEKVLLVLDSETIETETALQSTQEPAYRVDCPPLSKVSGFYYKIDNLMVDGFPCFRFSSKNGPWYLFSSRGVWVISNTLEDICSGGATVACKRKHGGNLPQNNGHYAYATHSGWIHDESIKILSVRPKRKLPSTDSQPLLVQKQPTNIIKQIEQPQKRRREIAPAEKVTPEKKAVKIIQPSGTYNGGDVQVTCPPFPAMSGIYRKVLEKVNGMPYYTRQSGSRCWFLFSSKEGAWLISDKQSSFTSGTAIVSSRETHKGAPPSSPLLTFSHLSPKGWKYEPQIKISEVSSLDTEPQKDSPRKVANNQTKTTAQTTAEGSQIKTGHVESWLTSLEGESNQKPQVSKVPQNPVEKSESISQPKRPQSSHLRVPTHQEMIPYLRNGRVSKEAFVKIGAELCGAKQVEPPPEEVWADMCLSTGCREPGLGLTPQQAQKLFVAMRDTAAQQQTPPASNLVAVAPPFAKYESTRHKCGECHACLHPKWKKPCINRDHGKPSESAPRTAQEHNPLDVIGQLVGLQIPKSNTDVDDEIEED